MKSKIALTVIITFAACLFTSCNHIDKIEQIETEGYIYAFSGPDRCSFTDMNIGTPYGSFIKSIKNDSLGHYHIGDKYKCFVQVAHYTDGTTKIISDKSCIYGKIEGPTEYPNEKDN